jgi:hypothetical protein
VTYMCTCLFCTTCEGRGTVQRVTNYPNYEFVPCPEKCIDGLAKMCDECRLEEAHAEERTA